ncbi:ABC transporter ATP-binding protein [Pseudobacter ginsenosidimutans]|uniref:ABC-2 type transport system ATP-binding protein n=1 Tax=Pseudobacter ginsenosidimutans TaxID=661488 RepID=A0A4Q7MUS4_9BACT|nr:ABC transporter ATP-binding protein [Pseudobacter ginsenosidimutans]QEC40636.1 ABC transporter ATP-binding protein [Pseudobacter ginsenosidimutans]RZS72645.1 ABC-2 type transport system ATP-binding protein [Pseudobacter ginsenosidimutans]
MSASIVKVENLSHRYSVQWAIKDINFELTRNGIYGLLGSNGAGKSTIMNIICGVIKQTQGEVYIQGVSLRNEPVKAKRHIGFLPQQPPLQTDLTVEEYLRHCANIRLMKPTAVKPAIDEVMSKVGISHFSKRLIRNLSGGYQQRVGIAQAIIHKPDFVVLDEPTNGLDPNQILEVRNLIREIAEERTVVLSTHILQEVQALCDNIWMINEGNVVFSGTLDEFDNQIMPNTLVVSLMATPSPDALKAIPGVINADHLGGTRFRIQFSDATEVTERIVAASVTNNWRLMEINLEKNSLDTIFAELSKKRK